MRFLIVGVLAFIAKYFVLIKYLLKQISLYLIAEKIQGQISGKPCTSYGIVSYEQR
jgi:hypothetical protein